jgi:hypothetical protein
MSTGAWIATGLVAAAIIAPSVVYAAASSTVAIGTTTSTQTANVTANRQLLTVETPPTNVVRTGIAAPAMACTRTYLPPTGKALMITHITYDIGSGTAGNDAWAAIGEEGCNGNYDLAETVNAHQTEDRTFPTGLPVRSLSIRTGPASAIVFVTGYLIPATGLPTAAVRATDTAAITRALNNHSK